MDEALPPRPDVAANQRPSVCARGHLRGCSAEPVPARAPATAPPKQRSWPRRKQKQRRNSRLGSRCRARPAVTASVPEAPARDGGAIRPAAAGTGAEPPRRGAAADALSSSANALAKRSGQQAADASRATGGPVAQVSRTKFRPALRPSRCASAATRSPHPPCASCAQHGLAEPARWTWQRRDESASTR